MLCLRGMGWGKTVRGRDFYLPPLNPFFSSSLIEIRGHWLDFLIVSDGYLTHLYSRKITGEAFPESS